MNKQEQIDFDIVIVGGHLVGLLLACALGNSSYRVAVIDKSDKKSKRKISKDFDLRVFALNIASQRIFDRLNLWPSISDARAFPYYSMNVWDESSAGHLIFDCNEIAATELGHIVEEQVILKALEEQVQQFRNITLYNNSSLISLVSSSDSVSLKLDGQTEISTRLLVAADGQFSTVRGLLGIETLKGSYSQKAIVATIETEFPHQHTAWQRFLKTGPLAFLPLNENHCSIVWSLDTEVAERYLDLDVKEFESKLSEAFENKLGKIKLRSDRRFFPLNYLHAKNYCLSRSVLIGDAAHTVHPLAGQGVNLGFMDAAVLAEELSFIAEKNKDPGLLPHLRRYERRRKADNLLMLGAVSGLKNLFGNNKTILAKIRGLGMNLFNVSGGVKRIAVKQAAGISGELPEIAKLTPSITRRS